MVSEAVRHECVLKVDGGSRWYRYILALTIFFHPTRIAALSFA